MVLVVEGVSSWFHLDEFFHHLLLWDVSQDDELRVLVQNGELVWDARVILSLLIFQAFLHLL